MKAIVIKIVFGIVLFALTACSPEAALVDLPTQARFPTETVTVTPNDNLTAIALERTNAPPTETATATATLTPTNDPSITPTATFTVTVTPSATITNTPSPTPTELPPIPPEDRPILAFALTAAASTVLPTDFQIPSFGGPDVTLIPTQPGTPNPDAPPVIAGLGTGTPIPVATTNTGSCTTAPINGFLTVYESNSELASQLGCAVGGVQSIPAAWQNFQTGTMVWLNGEILVLYTNNNIAQSVTDTWVQGVDPETTSETPPSGLFAPIRGFLKVWNTTTGVRDGLGWATTAENGVTASVQTFSNGRMIFLPGRSDILVLTQSAQGTTWLSVAGSYP